MKKEKKRTNPTDKKLSKRKKAFSLKTLTKG